MQDTKSALYANANSLHLHQDNLRWTLFAGCMTFLGASLAILSKGSYDTTERLWGRCFLFGAGNLWLIILGVENWYYNLFKLYARHCETGITNPTEKMYTIDEFTGKYRSKVSPFHPSFFFALLIVVVINYFLARLSFQWDYYWMVVYYFTTCFLLGTWRFTVYGLFLRPLSWLVGRLNYYR